MIVQKVHSRAATVILTVEDCAVLARACEEACAAGFTGLGQEDKHMHCEALGSAFKGLALAGTAWFSMRVSDVPEWRESLAELGIGGMLA